MFTFIGRFLKGLIVGWIMSLMMYLVKRALSKALGGHMPGAQNRTRPHPSSQTSQQNTYSRPTSHQNQDDVVETIWVGMSTDQLRRSFGAPLQRETVANGEIWSYANLNGQGIQTRVAIHKHAVTGWQDHPLENPQNGY